MIEPAYRAWVADRRNNHPQNGLAAGKDAHWTSDAGLWSLDDDYRVIIAKDRFDEAGQDAFLLKRFAGRRIALPSKHEYWPDKAPVAWHRTKRFGNHSSGWTEDFGVGQPLSASLC